MQILDDVAVRFSIKSELVPHVINYIEKSEVLSDNGTHADVMVHWGIKEMQHLVKVLGSEVPSPINKHYAWPGMYTPFKHQKITSSFLTLQNRAFCFNEAGTGKTSSVVWAADYLMTEKVIKRVLIICPLSIMYSAWQADVFKTAMHRTVGVAYGDSAKRKKIINGVSIHL
jgi:hypothetical protein